MANSAKERASLDGESFLTKQETAGLFRVSTKTIERWTKRGILHPIKNGHFLLYGRDEVAGLLDAMAEEPGRFKFGKDGRLIDTSYARPGAGSMSANCE